MLEFRIIQYGSSDYKKACALRQKWLRAPLGLTLNPEDLKNEIGDRHFGIWTESELVACLVITHLNTEEVKLRQMCVDQELRGQGIGARLISETEAALRELGVRRIQLAARITARGFYERLGYRATGTPFIEVTIEHVKMTKDLDANSFRSLYG